MVTFLVKPPFEVISFFENSYTFYFFGPSFVGLPVIYGNFNCKFQWPFKTGSTVFTLTYIKTTVLCILCVLYDTYMRDSGAHETKIHWFFNKWNNAWRPLLGRPNAERHDAKFKCILSTFQWFFMRSITESAEFGRQ